MFIQKDNDVIFFVKVYPKSQENKVIGWEGDKCKIRVKSIAEKNRANSELISFLSKILDIPKADIVIISGETSRIKKICVIKGNLEEIKKKLLQ